VAQKQGERGGAGLHPRLRVQGFEREGAGFTAVLRDRFSGQERRFPGLALVVHAAPERPLEQDGGGTLRDRLRARGLNAETIGDARAPRLMGEAIAHAHLTARE
jgi:hypothetical protein